MPVVIRGLPDGTGLLSARVSSLGDAGFAAEEFYDVVDLRPAEAAFAMEREPFFNGRIKCHGL